MIASRVRPLGTEPVSVAQALGRTAAEAVTALEPLPGFDNSAMDGYAVRAQDTNEAPVLLTVTGEARAGRPAARPLGARQAMRISTGARMPEGADAVVRSELVEGADDEGVRVRVGVAPGRDVRHAGEEVAAGGPLLDAGRRIGPLEIGALAAAGVESVACRCRARVAIVVTGDELTQAGRRLPPGGVRDSNRAMLEALVAAHGASVVSSRTVRDEPESVTSAIAEALDAADLVVTSGGMSVGPHDHVRPALAAAGVALAFSGVALAPGRPAAFGSSSHGQPVLGLPGNPLAALVAFRLLVEPALNALEARRSAQRSVTLVATQPVNRRPNLMRAVPCRIGAEGATPFDLTGHGPTAALGADGLALVDPGSTILEAGAPVEVTLL